MQNLAITINRSMDNANAPANTVREHLGRVLASPHFVRSETLSRFLRFVVEQTLEGNGQQLKEYRLGVDLFHRGDSFDPRIDPIVRMQAAKLRSRLAEYYAQEGKNDRLIISVQKGGYTPSFTQVDAPTPETPVSPATTGSIAVLPFVSISADPANDYFCDGLTEELTNALVSKPGLRVVSRTSAFAFKNTPLDVREIGLRLSSETIVEGSVRKVGNQIRVNVQLVEVATGCQVQSRTYDRELDNVLHLQDELAQTFAAMIAPTPWSTEGTRPFLVKAAAALAA